MPELCGRVLRRPSRARRCRAAPMLRFPTCFPSFRVVGEKQLPQEIIFLAWSPKRDLIALANTTGEVSELVREVAWAGTLEPQFPLWQTWRIAHLSCPYISAWLLTLRDCVKYCAFQTGCVFHFLYGPEEQIPSKFCTPRTPGIDLARDAPSDPAQSWFQISRE